MQLPHRSITGYVQELVGLIWEVELISWLLSSTVEPNALFGWIIKFDILEMAVP